jgi:hypothetical protein
MEEKSRENERSNTASLLDFQDVHIGMLKAKIK